jgi:hypothetical protein
MSNAEWITDRPPTKADGDHIGSVHVKLHPRGISSCLIYWSHVAAGAPWQHTSHWQPPTEPTPTEPDRIAALEQRVAELEAMARPSAELAEDISYQQLKVEQMRTSAALLIAHANLIEAQP